MTEKDGEKARASARERGRGGGGEGKDRKGRRRERNIQIDGQAARHGALDPFESNCYCFG
jgi:hypothetical protein